MAHPDVKSQSVDVDNFNRGSLYTDYQRVGYVLTFLILCKEFLQM